MSYYSFRLFEKIREYLDKETELSPFIIYCKITAFSIQSVIDRLFSRKPKSNTLNIGIIFNGGFGDQVISAQWVYAFLEKLNHEKCNYYATLMFPKINLGQMIVKDFPGEILVAKTNYRHKHRFDLLLSIDQFVKIINVNKQAIKIYAPFLSDSIEKCKIMNRQLLPISSARNQYQLMMLSLIKGWNRYDLLGLCGFCDFNRNSPTFYSIDKDEVSKTLSKYKLPELFITIHAGIGDFPVENKTKEEYLLLRANATKCISKNLGNEIVKELHRQIPSVPIIQIGDGTGHNFDGVDIQLSGKTSLKDSIDILYASKVHIGNDSGLIHVRHAFGKQSIVLYGPTSAKFLGYDTDFNFQASCAPCMWLTLDWNYICPKGKQSTECMNDLKVDKIVEIAKNEIECLSN